MLRGRDIAGLPVYSLKEGTFLGRTDQCYLNLNRRCLGGIVMEKRPFSKIRSYFHMSSILKIYKDGIIIKEKGSLFPSRHIPQNTILYSTFLQYMEMPLKEGNVITDLFFDENFRIVGGEVSSGVWNDMVKGRGFWSWRELLANINRL